MKKVMKWTALALSLTLALGLMACGAATTETTTKADTATTTVAGEEKTDDTTAAVTDGEPVKLVIAARGGSHVDAINAVKESFEKENNVIIEVSGLEAADLKKNVMLDSTKSVSAYDLIMADDPWMPEFAAAQIFLNLSEAGYQADSDFVAKSLDIGKVPYGEGDLYALPFSGNVMLFFYNTELVKDLPSDWESVLQTAQQLKADGQLGYVVRGQQGNPIVSDWLPIYWAYGGEVFDKDWKSQVNSQAGKDALKLYMDLLENGANYEKNDIVASVSEGKAGMALGWPSWFVSKEGATAAYGIIPTKANASAQAHGSGMIGNWMMGVTANSANPELAIKLLQHLTSAESQKAEALVGGVPTRTSVLTDAELVSVYPYFPTILEGTENSVIRPRTEKWSLAEEALGAELSAAISGTKSIDDALAAAETEMNKAVE